MGSNPTPSAGQRHFLAFGRSRQKGSWAIIGHIRSRVSSAMCEATSDAAVPTAGRCGSRSEVTRRPAATATSGGTSKARKRDAQRAAAELIAEVDRGGHREVGRHTVNELLDRWMAHIEAQGRAESTLARYRSAINANIKPRLGAKAIDKLGPADIDRLLRPAGPNRSYAAQRPQEPRHPLRRLQPSPAVGLARPQPGTPVFAARASGDGKSTRRPGGIRRLLEACANDHEDSAASSMSPPPPAPGEASCAGCAGATSTRPCHAGDCPVHLRRRPARRCQGHQDPPGPPHRPRPIDRQGAATHRERVDQRAAMADIGLSPTAYVWSQDLDGATPYRPDRVTGAFRALRDRLELSHVTFHSLRHFTATTLAAGGVGIRTIAGRLGHANPGITLRTYAHFLDVADREAAIAIGDALAELQPASVNRASASSSARRGTTSRRPSRTDGSSRLATKS